MIKEEILRLLKTHKQVVITGMHGAGKSTLISQLSPKYDCFRSCSYNSDKISKSLMDQYRLFDRFNLIDRYIFQYKTDDSLPVILPLLHEYFGDACFVYMLDDRWLHLQNEPSFIVNGRVHFYNRYLHICEVLYENNIGSVHLLSTPRGLVSSEFTENFLETIKELKWTN